MINFCEVHKEMLIPFQNKQHCCGLLFDAEPIFTNRGTCYRTKRKIYENFPYTFSSIKVWTKLLKKETPGNRVMRVITLRSLINVQCTLINFLKKSSLGPVCSY